MLIPESYLEREKDVIEGFDPEVAWVTQGGYDELDERLAVRPTSESIIAPYLSQWIRSHRDLPMRVNQWCSVIRWEATETKPFFRTKEFLWQEGHTAHASDGDCEATVKDQMAAGIVMVPFEDSGEAIHEGETCALRDDDAVETAYFARSY